MQPNTQYCQPGLYSSYLHAIKGIKFTRRQVDILACLSTGRNAKTIANFLQIDSERTVHAHELTIREKLGCGSRDSIIAFLEQCEEFPALKKYHQILRTHFLFEKSAQKIAALVGQTHPKLIIICKDLKEPNTVPILKSLEYYLKQAGIKISIQKEAPKEMDTPFLIVGDQISPQDHEKQINVNFKDLNNFYPHLFELIKELVPNVELTKVEAEFKQEYDAIHNGGQPIVVNAREPATNLKDQRKSWPYFFKEKRNKIIAAIFLCLSLFGAWLLMGETKQKDITPVAQSIRSDLITPTDSALLKRPELIEQIEKKLNQQKGIQTVALVGIVGMGGVGKTTLARYFGKLQDSSLVWEINAETKESLMNSFKDLAQALAKTKEEKEELEFIKAIQNQEEKEKQLLLFVKTHLKPHPNWLLIYDNVDAFVDVKNYLPQDHKVWGNGRVIITSRDGNIQNTSYISPNHVIQLGELSQAEALILFSKILYNCIPNKLTAEQKEQALNFLKNIPSFPLDVSVAAYYIKDTHMSYEQYVERIARYGQDFETIQTSFLKEGSNYEKNRYGIISLSFKKLIEINPKFKDLLLFICLLDSQNIPKSLLESYKDSETVNSFVHALKKYSLITSETVTGHKEQQYAFSLHRSTQCLGKEFILNTLKESMKKKLLEEMVTSIKAFYEKYSKRKKDNIALVIQHLEAFLKNLPDIHLPKILEENHQLDILYVIGYAHCNFSHNYLIAKNYFSQILEIHRYRQHFPRRIIATILKDLARMCFKIDYFDECLKYSQESIKLCDKDPHSEILIVENFISIAIAYNYKNNFQMSKYYLETALNRISKSDNPLKAELEAKIYGRLALLYSTTYINQEQAKHGILYGLKSLEKLDGSQVFYNAKRTSVEKIPCRIAKSKIKLGEVYCRLGQYKNAMIQGFQEAQYIIDNALDDCNYTLLQSIIDTNKGEILLRENKPTEAEYTLTKALVIPEKLFGINNINWFSFPSRILRAEAKIRLKKLGEGYADCLSIFKMDRKPTDNISRLIYLTCFYHGAFIKYKQNDYKKAIEHFTDFFKKMKEFCKDFLDEKIYKDLEDRGTFTTPSYDPKRAKEDIKKHLKNSVDIFTAIYGNHPFVKDYIAPNYNEAIKPWWKFW